MHCVVIYTIIDNILLGIGEHMKKVIITQDKKSILLITIYTIALIFNLYFLSVNTAEAFQMRGLTMNAINMFIILAAVALYVYFIVMKNMVYIITLKEDRIGFGLFGLSAVYIASIKKVMYDNDIELHTKGDNKYIRGILPKENRQQYEAIINHIENKSNKRLNTEKVVDGLISKEAGRFTTKKGEKFGINGLLVLFALTLIFNAISNVQGIMPLINDGGSVVRIILHAITLVACLITMVYFFGKKKQAPLVVKMYFALLYITGFIMSVILILMGTQTFNIQMVSSTIGSITLFVLIWRYFKISKRVKATFVN